MATLAASPWCGQQCDLTLQNQRIFVVFCRIYLQMWTVHDANEQLQIKPVAARLRTCVRLAGMMGLLFGLLLTVTTPSSSVEAASTVSTTTGIAGQDVSVEMVDGLLTATFSDRADDAVLAARLPALIANGVEAVSLRGAPVQDLRPLARMTRLKALDLCGTLVRDVSPLAGLTNLRALNLQFLRIGDLSPIAGLSRLRSLNIGGTPIRDLTPLAGLTNLNGLVLAVTKVKDLAPLAHLRQLTSLDLGGTWVSNLRPLAELRNLSVLSLNGAPVEDLLPLARMANLRTLDLAGTQVSDVRPLAGLRELRTLDLEGTQVADVTPLAGLTALRTVALGGSLVRDKTPLAHLAMAPAARQDQGVADPVLFWNDQTNRSIQMTRTDAFQASRVLALESIAVMDTVRSIEGSPAFMARLAAPRDVPVGAAVAAAAHTVLIHAFPARKPALDTALAYALGNEPPGPARDQATAFGTTVATALLMMRDEDGWHAAPVTRSGFASGQWRPTPPEFLPSMGSPWATMQPFALVKPSQFRPPGPPAPGSDAFRLARAEVAALGEAHSTTRTAEQKEIAHYWSDAIGTYAPAGHWNAIAANIVGPLRLGLTVEAELFAELNVAMADAGIAMADAKFTYWAWRPVTAIRTGSDGDPPIPDWTPLLETPNHPSYVSGHASFSGAAATVMTDWFGTRAFTFSSASLPGVKRDFTSFQQAAEEAAASRVYGGIHFPSDNADGLATGRAVGAWTMAVFMNLGEDRGPLLMVMDESMGMGAKTPRTIEGCALDNLAPVTAVTVRLDGGVPFSVPVDEHGVFTLTPQRLGLSGRHEVVLAATSATGRTSTLRTSIE
jgi:Leucine-rich repeat (LRR) protein/membrane-associated phospholipid phosphatase